MGKITNAVTGPVMVLSAVAAGGYAGYEYGSHINSNTQEDIARAQDDVTESKLDYLALTETGTCESHVLETVLDLNVASSRVKAESALNTICGVRKEHGILAEKATDGFQQISDNVSALARVKDATGYEWEEKTGGIIVGIVGVGAIIVSLATTYGVVKKRKSRIIKSK